MSWKCALGLHSPSLFSISRKPDGLHALCKGCGVPLDRSEDSGWRPAQPLMRELDSADKAA